MGLRVIAIDTGDDKRDLTLSLGAEKWIDFRLSKDLVTEVIAITGGGAHAAVVTVGGGGAYVSASMYLRPKGRLMVVGMPPSNMVALPLVLIATQVCDLAIITILAIC